MAPAAPVLGLVLDLRFVAVPVGNVPLPLPLLLPLPPHLVAPLLSAVVATPPLAPALRPPPHTWTAVPLHQALLDLGDVGAGAAEGRRVVHHLPRPALLAPLEAAGPARPRARAPLAPRAHLTVDLRCTLHEFVAGLVVLGADMVARAHQLVQALPAARAHLAAHTRLTVGRTLEENTLPLRLAGHQALGAAVLALAQVKVEGGAAASAEVFVEARVALRPAFGARVSVWRARAVEAWRARGHAHADLLHPHPLQVHEEARFAGQAAIVVGAGQTAPLLAPQTHTRELFVLPVPGTAVLLTTSVFHAVQEDQNRANQL